LSGQRWSGVPSVPTRGDLVVDRLGPLVGTDGKIGLAVGTVGMFGFNSGPGGLMGKEVCPGF
jgi:hypothetical protein